MHYILHLCTLWDISYCMIYVPFIQFANQILISLRVLRAVCWLTISANGAQFQSVENDQVYIKVFVELIHIVFGSVIANRSLIHKLSIINQTIANI